MLHTLLFIIIICLLRVSFFKNHSCACPEDIQVGDTIWVPSSYWQQDEFKIYRGVRVPYKSNKFIAIKYCDGQTEYVTTKFWATSGWTNIEPDVASIQSIEQWTRHCNTSKRPRVA